MVKESWKSLPFTTKVTDWSPRKQPYFILSLRDITLFIQVEFPEFKKGRIYVSFFQFPALLDGKYEDISNFQPSSEFTWSSHGIDQLLRWVHNRIYRPYDQRLKRTRVLEWNWQKNGQRQWLGESWCVLVQHIGSPNRSLSISIHVSFENLELDQGNIDECLCARHLPIRRCRQWNILWRNKLLILKIR